MNDQANRDVKRMEDPLIFAIQGQAWLAGEGEAAAETGGGCMALLVFVMAGDEDGAVRRALTALAEQGYERCEFDRIGLVAQAPDDADILEAAYNDAAGGDVAIVTMPTA